MGIFIGWRNSSGGFIGSSPSVYNTLVNTWELVTTGPVIAPAGAVTARAEIRGYKDTSSPAGYADNAKFSWENVFIKYCMPDLGQHSRNWCWVAAAANSIYWYSQNGYLQLIDNLADPTPNDNEYITTMILHPPTPISPSPHSVYYLFQEIAADCLYPGVPENTLTIDNTWDRPINDIQYFFGLQEFIHEQGAPLIVHEIVDNNLLFPVPPADGINVIYRPPTLVDYQRELENCQDVLLWLDQNGRHDNTENYPYRYEDTDHVVTGVAFSSDNSWILVSDPWSTESPDHNNAFENKIYDNLMVMSTPESPLWVWYNGGPVQVVKMVYISPTAPTPPVENYIKECMPDLGQHCENWCWTAAAANSIWWYASHGYPELIDNLADPSSDNEWIDQWYPDPIGMDNYRKLLAVIASYCLGLPPEATFCHPVTNLDYFYGLQAFIDAQGAPLYVHEILNPDKVGMPRPPEDGENVVYDNVTFDNYKTELKRCQDVLLQLDFKNMQYYEPPYAYEGLDHIVTGVSYYDGGAGNSWIQVSDPWTPSPWGPGPDHNNDNAHVDRYDNLAVVNNDPLTVTYTYWTPGGNVSVNVEVVKLIYISPENVGAGASVNLVAGWNLVGFTAVGASDNPDNLFPGLTYLENFRLLYWVAPGGPYKVQPEGQVLIDNTGYWVWIDENYTATTTGTRPASRTENMKTGWNLVCFPVDNDSTTPHNVFPGLTYLENFRLIYWVAPGGPYKTLGENVVLLDNTGYWVWIDRDFTITVPA